MEGFGKTGIEQKTLSEDEKEELFDKLIESLPTQLQQKWAFLGELPLSEALDRLQQVVQQRDIALNIPISHSSSSDIETSNECPIAIAEYLQKLESSNEDMRELGRGASGRVISSNRNPQACYKILFNKDRRDIIHGENDVLGEADIQELVYELSVDDEVTVPEVFCVIDLPELRAIMMQQLNAISLKDIMEHKPGARLPENFEIDSFFEKLIKFITKMHDHHYYHRDLHAGNIMVDMVTGTPCVIDFGLSKKAFDKKDATELILPTGEKVKFSDDFNSLEFVRNKLQEFIRK